MITHDLAQQVIVDSAAVLAPILSSLLVGLLVKALQRVHLQVTSQQEAQLRYFAERAVHVAEETATAKGPDKLMAAVAMVQGRYPKLPVEAVVDVIHAELSRQRADAGNQLFQPRSQP